MYFSTFRPSRIRFIFHLTSIIVLDFNSTEHYIYKTAMLAENITAYFSCCLTKFTLKHIYNNSNTFFFLLQISKLTPFQQKNYKNTYSSYITNFCHTNLIIFYLFAIYSKDYSFLRKYYLFQFIKRNNHSKQKLFFLIFL